MISKPFGFRTVVDAVQANQPPALMRPAASHPAGARRRSRVCQDQPRAGSEHARGIRVRLDYDFPENPVWLYDGTDGYQMVECRHLFLFQDLQDEALAYLHAGRAEDRADRPGCPPLLSDDLAKIHLSHTQLEDRRLLTFHFRDLDLLRIVNENFRNHFQQLFHVLLLWSERDFYEEQAA
jgi:hypothetical protein